VAQREPEPHGERLTAATVRGVVGHDLAGGVVDGRDVVGVEGVPHPERVRQDAHPDREDRVVAAELEVLRGDQPEQHAKADHVQQHDEAAHAVQRAPVRAGQAAPELRQP
jgi:hypothetical protein